MRPTGALHLGHYHGVLKNWVRLQHEYPCLFFVADWHALTTQYDNPQGIEQASWDMVIDWLAAGVDPNQATLFIQSRVPEHAELHLLMSMMTPLGWLERVPTYKDQQEKLAGKDLTTYGFLGYPLLMSADILIYRADKGAMQTWSYKIESHFLDAFGRPNASSDCPCERDRQMSVVQSLHLMHSKNLQSKLSNKESRAAQLAASSRTPEEIVTELYYLTVSRPPDAEELRRSTAVFEVSGATRQTATEDVFWALLNSAEFVLNH